MTFLSKTQQLLTIKSEMNRCAIWFSESYRSIHQNAMKYLYVHTTDRQTDGQEDRQEVNSSFTVANSLNDH